ncbi:LysM peptidoglycan-binding domain-containing protein [Arthrobacter sp. TWP1-1]|uniref:LysM peptidoglycan-binding domain-containing protein n=1 Tax=Arthrobacter sp. TWP1-1 TaxID=2804568 RepID=UPI003CF1A3E6
MRRQTVADLAMTAAILLLGGSLIFSGFSLLRLRWTSIVSGQPLTLPELLGVGGAGAGIALLCWWLVAMICALVSPVAQRLGAVRVAAFTGACSPAFMRRAVIAVVGLNLIAAPLASAAPSGGTDPRWQPGTVATAPATPQGVDPRSTAPSVASQPSTSAASDNILPPATSAPIEPAWIPRTAVTDPDLLVRPPARTTAAEAGGEQGAAVEVPSTDPQEGNTETDVVVKSGDSLWSIVAATLGPFSNDVDVALAWPRWYNTNREAIGADPNFILPGQVLHPPPGQ